MVQIPEPAKERLLYLMRFLETSDVEFITSGEIETFTGWASHTIRKDISYLGGDCDDNTLNKKVGSCAGYKPEVLIPAIKQALGLNRRRRFCVVGLGRLGSAYLNFPAFEADEFELIAGFDTNVNRVEILQSPVPLYPAYKMGEVISRFSIETALLCVPEDAAQKTAEKLTAAGIRGIVNFAPVVLRVGPDVAVRNVFVVDELRALAAKMKN
jgi:redox-sensing transcriptional repressor